MKFLKLGAAIAVLAACSGVVPALADDITVTFDFNNLNSGTSSQNASSATIAAYMQSVLRTAFAAATPQISQYATKATVGGSGGIGQQGASSYEGEGFTTGPRLSGTTYDLTLANTDYAMALYGDCPAGFNSVTTPDGRCGKGTAAVPNTTKWTDSAGGSASYSSADPPQQGNSNIDGFIKNCTAIDPTISGSKGCSGSSADIFMSFANIGTLKITSISFDYQIFPNGDCADNTYDACGGSKATSGPRTGYRPNYPDLSVWSGDEGTGTKYAHFWGIDPGVTSPLPITFTQSPNSGSSTEQAPQRLDTALITGMSTTTLDFMDWPNTIGIDNLKITFSPEPGSVAMFGVGLLGLATLMRRKRKTKAEVATA